MQSRGAIMREKKYVLKLMKFFIAAAGIFQTLTAAMAGDRIMEVKVADF